MRALLKAAAALGAATLAPIAFTGVAQAAPAAPIAESTVYFSTGFLDCAIGPDGSVGCNSAQPARMTMNIAGADIVLPFQVDEVVIDLPWAPGHPGFAPGTPFALPGGNPPIEEVGTSNGPWGTTVTHAGATCGVGFRASFSCESKGHKIGMISGTFYGS
ncbi:hypothetical protein [Nocardia cyriacigeorgica]|uniref:Uncharacterized protein n=1 Tax=Nocardia cyriacigeorgica TaxID=135487 RepID=A0A5R8NY12_9NOCA|nr:hypothetical protein [Nocardia cyriacigeorgica]TLF81204.1 hypothetical protein FEK34_06070 [Nocardia cyriacigeorgica]